MHVLSSSRDTPAAVTKVKAGSDQDCSGRFVKFDHREMPLSVVIGDQKIECDGLGFAGRIVGLGSECPRVDIPLCLTAEGLSGGASLCIKE